jgi:hypothetical protein
MGVRGKSVLFPARISSIDTEGNSLQNPYDPQMTFRRKIGHAFITDSVNIGEQNYSGF